MIPHSGEAATSTGNDDATAGAALPATAGSSSAPSLSTNLKIYLWQEYQVGIGGRKAAKLFTQKEWPRGASVKHMFWQKVVWDIVSGKVR